MLLAPPSVLCSVQGVSSELQEAQSEVFHLRQAVQDKDMEMEVRKSGGRERK